MTALELTVRIGAPAHGGHCVARHEGRVIFVRHGIPGELAKIRLTESGDDARFWRGDVIEVLEADPARRAHFWAAADALKTGAAGKVPVGGAEFGHMDLAKQRELKSLIFTEQLTRLGGMDAAEAGFTGVQGVPGESADGLGWRTRVAFAVDAKGRLSMHGFRSHELIPVTEMPLALEVINSLRLWELPLRGISRVEVAAPAAGGEPLVLFVEDGTRPGAADKPAAKLPAGVSAAAITQTRGTAADGSGELRRIRGRGWVAEEAAGHTYRVSGEGFWQIHRLAPQVLTEEVMAILDPKPGQVVADLYAGAGLFTAPLAEAVGETGLVHSIEGAPGTSKDARRNLHAFAQAKVTQGRVEKVLGAQLAEHGRKLDSVVLDPPRTGAGKQVVRQLAQAAPERIAYVSCDPASFARDVADLNRNGYALTSVKVFDLYPNTHHMETVGVFERRSSSM